MASTLEKIQAIVTHVKALPPEDLSGEGRDIAEILQIMQGFGIDPISLLLPKSDADADVLVDKMLMLLFSLRGDDLPPFSIDRYGEAERA